MPTVDFKFSNGDRVKDIVTGLEGIVVAQTQHLNKCLRYLVQPPMPKVKDAKLPDLHNLDEDQLELVKAGAVKVKTPATKTGGPFPDVSRVREQ